VRGLADVVGTARMKISTDDLIFAAVIAGTVVIAGSFVLMPFVGFAHWQPQPMPVAPQSQSTGSATVGRLKVNGPAGNEAKEEARVAPLTIKNRARAASRGAGRSDFILAPASLSPASASPCGE
jgi:hypothetical protein